MGRYRKGWTAEDWREELGERMAIMEFEGGLERGEAERRARELVGEAYRRHVLEGEDSVVEGGEGVEDERSTENGG